MKENQQQHNPEDPRRMGQSKRHNTHNWRAQGKNENEGEYFLWWPRAF